jgi:sulfatase maturation enzyme AslB (radical SAM superfamily)
MCPRRLQGGPLNPWLELTEIELEIFKKWFSINFIKQLEQFSICGNLGDPIIAKNTIPVYRHLRKINPSIRLKMHTNGSARNFKFWKDLAELDVNVIFGIDGLENTHGRYRIGTDWNKIIKNATIFIDAGGNARWDMLVFDHNKHQVKECEDLAYKIGFKEFQKKNSSRFKEGRYVVIDDHGRLIDVLYPTDKSVNFIKKIKIAQQESKSNISCKAKYQNEIYIAANGNVSPCCWLDLEWVPPINEQRIHYMNKINRYPNLHKNTLEEIFDSNYFGSIEDTWKNDCLITCKKQCGSFDKLGEQFER